MGVSRAVGQPNYGSAGSGFIPEIWSGNLIRSLYATTFYGEIANTDYEGEIKSFGDTVHIRTVPAITVNDYVVGGGLTYEKPTSDKVELSINKAKSFAFEVSDVDRMQADVKLIDAFSKDASERMKMAIDKDLLGTHYAEAHESNAGDQAGVKSGSINLGKAGAPLLLTKANIIDVIVDCGTVLDEQDVPQEGRWFVIPAWLKGSLLKSEVRDASIMGDATSTLRNGKLGELGGFTLYESNQLSTVNDVTAAVQATNCMFGHKQGLTFASQVTEMDTLTNQNDFGKLVRGLTVYGSKVIDSKCIGHLYAAKG